MSLIKAFAKVDEKGRIQIPENVRKTMKIKSGQLFEFKPLHQHKIQLMRRERPQ